MGIMDKVLNVLHLEDEDDEDFYNEDYDYEDEYEEEARPKSISRKEKREKKEEMYEDDYNDSTYHDKGTKTSPKVTQIRSVKKPTSAEVCVIKPNTVEDAREITETLLNNRIVVLNVEGLDVEVAQRIIDFTSGSCFAINGKLQKISNYIFIIAPSTVDLSGDVLSLVDNINGRGGQLEY